MCKMEKEENLLLLASSIDPTFFITAQHETHTVQIASRCYTSASRVLLFSFYHIMLGRY